MPVTARILNARASRWARLNFWPALFAAVLAWLVLLAIEARPPFQNPASDVLFQEIIPNMVPAGGQTVIIRRVAWHRRCDATVHTSVISNRGPVTLYEPIHIAAPLNLGEIETRRTFAVPRDLGPARRRIEVDIYCNWLQRHFWPVRRPSPDVLFEIVP